VTSERQIKANRANARASTGPKTARGRSHAARNARRHALSLPVYSDPALSEEVEALARKIVPIDADDEIQELAHRIAEAQIDLNRARRARHQLLSEALTDPDYESEVMLRKKTALVIRYARRDPFAPIPNNVMEFLDSKPEGPYKFATILADNTRQLLALDRYERRAVSRRNRAIQSLDAVRVLRASLVERKTA
jgi:hypothetical protein